MVPNETHRNSPSAISMAAGLDLLIALWFFVSPWVYGAYHNADSWNSWIVGGVMAIIAAVCLSNIHAASASWVNVVLAVWVFFSPWIYGYTMNTGRFINSLCVGIVAFVLSLAISMNASRTATTTVPHRM
jgi:SPW repeat